MEATRHLGYPETLVPALGDIFLAATVLYAIPHTRFVGALLLPRLPGGATASLLHLEEPLWSHVLFPVYLAALVWAAVFLRDRRLLGLLWVQEM